MCKLKYSNHIEIPSPTVTPTQKPTTAKPTTRPKTTTAKVTAPAKASFSSVKTGKKKVSLKVKTVKNAKGYMVQYAMNKKFKSAKTKYITKTSLTIKKLIAKKTYYFRVKAYKLNGKKKVYSTKWSKTVKAKIKK